MLKKTLRRLYEEAIPIYKRLKVNRPAELSNSTFIVEMEKYVKEKEAKKEKGNDNTNDSLKSKLCGKHKLRLQWLEPTMGTITISDEMTDNGYYGEGRIVGNNGCFIMKGYFNIQDANNITFEGTTEQSISYIADGEVGYRNGMYHLKSYNGRKYWRMQEMDDPVDDCVDYIDIFF